MGTPAEKLAYLKETKEAIKSALIAQGQTVSDTDTFRSYADKVLAIKSGDTEEIILENVALSKGYTISRTQNPLVSEYSPITFKESLTDGVADLTTPINPENDSWFAFQTYYNTAITGGSYGVVGTVTVDLGEVYNIRRARVCLANANITKDTYSFIANMPDRVSLYLSESGESGSFTYMGDFETQPDDNIAYWSEITFPEFKARYAYVEIVIHAEEVAAHYALINEIKIYGR